MSGGGGQTIYCVDQTFFSYLNQSMRKMSALLPSVQRWRQSEQCTESHRHKQRAEDCDHSSQSQAPLRPHHVDLTCKEQRRENHWLTIKNDHWITSSFCCCVLTSVYWKHSNQKKSVNTQGMYNLTKLTSNGFVLQGELILTLSSSQLQEGIIAIKDPYKKNFHGKGEKKLLRIKKKSSLA